MDFRFSAEDEAFRKTVRDFFTDEYPADLLAKIKNGQQVTKADYQRSERAYNDKGWVAVNWPQEYGGTGWTPTQKYIFDDELERAGALSVVPMGLLYVAPVIYTFGSEEQKKRWLPDILASRTFWGQGYSEPEAGSDLASLQCKAVRDGDDYIVTGTKIWTSLGHYADWLFCLVRTSNTGKKQEGISFLCMDAKTPGITVYPITTIDGTQYLNRIEFDDVRVPAENLIGEEGMGWTYSKYLLSNERTSYAHIAGKWADIARLKEIATTIQSGNRTLLDEPAFAQKLAKVEVDLTALEFMVLRTLSAVSAGETPGGASSALKILATENAQAITELFLEANGSNALPFFPDRNAADWHEGLDIPAYAAPTTAAYFFNRAQTIYGGATEVQKNIISKQVLGVS
ncbi:MAG: acyl-CoA dehydrogenase [Rhodobiaceae bacterium]|nr:MAG: acyl-CoA dehydrogenase [Rhodobiaceae bacterium]